ncbi:hypothetical protein RRF57_003300 [Xylaria bambusicola]|uniref:Uncharacterized protein n=1 Tax=Xylaria bambusicola TaxID=326684 RepID=A0AAN7U7V1_9PEZI
MAYNMYEKCYKNSTNETGPASLHSLVTVGRDIVSLVVAHPTTNIAVNEVAVKRIKGAAPYSQDIISFYTLVECYTTFQVLSLFLRPY